MQPAGMGEAAGDRQACALSCTRGSLSNQLAAAGEQPLVLSEYRTGINPWRAPAAGGWCARSAPAPGAPGRPGQPRAPGCINETYQQFTWSDDTACANWQVPCKAPGRRAAQALFTPCVDGLPRVSPQPTCAPCAADAPGQLLPVPPLLCAAHPARQLDNCAHRSCKLQVALHLAGHRRPAGNSSGPGPAPVHKQGDSKLDKKVTAVCPACTACCAHTLHHHAPPAAPLTRPDRSAAPSAPGGSGLNRSTY